MTMTLSTGQPSQLTQLTLGQESSKTGPGVTDWTREPRELFQELLLPVKTALYNFIRKAVNFSPEADDIFQEALLKAFRYFHSFDQERSSFKTWIFTVAHNLLKDVFRARLNWVSLEESVDVPAEMVHVSPEVQEIYSVASELKPRDREVFFLYYYNEFTIVEIAGITGLSRPNVKFILHRARTVIKKALEVTG